MGAGRRRQGFEPVNPRPNWTKAIATRKSDAVKPSLVNMINSGKQLHFEGETPAEIAKRARESLAAIHNLGVSDPDEQRRQYQALRTDAAFQRLMSAFDLWCALWFWPADKLERAPLAQGFVSPTDEAVEIAASVAHDPKYRFFHWELEFPDVFNTSGAGFDAVIGNPPWEIQKPNSKEFFSNIDPLYRGYGKQEALKHQEEYFSRDARHEQAWMEERARIKALSNWVKYAAVAFGDAVRTDSNGKQSFDFNLGAGFAKSSDLHRRWELLRRGRSGYADSQHPFVHQGSADLNTYKMFLEQGYRLLRQDGRLGMIVPSGVYSDQGSTALRTLFLEKSRWEWLFSFENREKVFEIDSRFKFNPLIVQKGGRTEAIQTAFMRHNPKDWDEAEKYALAYPGERVTQFSPGSKALLEIRSEQDLRTLEKLYSNGVLLGDRSERGWGIEYAREFDMTNDSKLFPPRPWWEEQGYRSDEYGHWLKGPWRPYDGPKSILKRERDLVLSPDGMMAMKVGEIEDVALPLYEGRMIGQFDFSEKGWVSGRGRTAVWENIPFSNKRIQPQYLMAAPDYVSQKDRDGRPKSVRGVKLAFMDVTSATNEKTTIAAIVQDMPCGNSAPLFRGPRPWELCAAMNTFAYDYVACKRCAGLHLNYFIVAETVLPSQTDLGQFGLRLAGPSELFAAEWLPSISAGASWRSQWALTEHQRLRCRCIVDAVTALTLGMSEPQFRYLLDSCDRSEVFLADKARPRTLDPKGFWRVDKEKPPHLRHTVLSLIAFHELERVGLDAFLDMNDGEGWMLPETLRLADYGLGHDDRAKEHQPVASVLGPRFYDWQLSQSVAESWEECEMHAELLNKIVPPPAPAKDEEAEPEASQLTLI